MSDLADWSAIPADIYVIAARSHDGIVHEVDCCSVPMATSPEVRYCRADYVDQRIAAAIEAERQKWQAEIKRLQAEQPKEVSRFANERELVETTCIAVKAERKACEEIARRQMTTRTISPDGWQTAYAIADAIASRGKAKESPASRS